MGKDNKSHSVKEALGIDGIYPRWLGVGNLSSSSSNETTSITSLLQIGDSWQEKQLKVAVGFPNIAMTSSEILIPYTFAEYFGFTDFVVNEELWNASQSLNLTFDAISFMSQGNSSELRRILLSSTDPSDTQTKAQKLLVHMGLNENVTFGMLS